MKWTGFPAARTWLCRMQDPTLGAGVVPPWGLGRAWLSPTQAQLPAEVWAGGKTRGRLKRRNHFIFHQGTGKGSFSHDPTDASVGQRMELGLVLQPQGSDQRSPVESPLCVRPWLSVSSTGMCQTASCSMGSPQLFLLLIPVVEGGLWGPWRLSPRVRTLCWGSHRCFLKDPTQIRWYKGNQNMYKGWC